MKKFHDVLECLVLMHEIDSLINLYNAVEKVALRYNFDRLGLFQRTVTPAGNNVAWQNLFEHIVSADVSVLFDSDADGTLLSFGTSGDPYYWDRATVETKEFNPAIYRRLRTRCVRAAETGLNYGVTFPVYQREGLAGAMVFACENRIELSTLEVSLFATLARETLKRSLFILQCGKPTRRRSGIVPELSAREVTILRNLADGMTSVETGKAIGLTNHTVNWYVSGLQQKLHARNRQNLVALAFRLGLIS
ncbi:helix-turn-helix transcriptional regulator [uncultured Martelella sp.]|uniref:helix-turn-helix transcriptional regulator n=1 Tax=uncultured Martelella sp. TaxID=392331 RepID=UPI0029C848A7|nr:helix-turn-helix transcriptional regulator [uncultured Martelella sp.]